NGDRWSGRGVACQRAGATGAQEEEQADQRDNVSGSLHVFTRIGLWCCKRYRARDKKDTASAAASIVGSESNTAIAASCFGVSCSVMMQSRAVWRRFSVDFAYSLGIRNPSHSTGKGGGCDMAVATSTGLEPATFSSGG